MENYSLLIGIGILIISTLFIVYRENIAKKQRSEFERFQRLSEKSIVSIFYKKIPSLEYLKKYLFVFGLFGLLVGLAFIYSALI